MNWAQQKQKARDTVHKTFSVPGFYSDDTVTDQEVTVRLHRKSAFIGDDYDEFSPGLFSQINRVIVDQREVIPKRGSTIRIPDFQDVVVNIENYKEQGEYKLLCEVWV